MGTTTLRLTVLLLCLLPQVASASTTDITLFGHQVQIYSNSDGDKEALRVDSKKLVEEYGVDIVEVGSLGDIGFAIGTTSPGGNMCDGSLFILSFAPGQPVRLDGPLDTCSLLEHKIERDRIVVEVQPSSTSSGSRWTWTAANGFGPPEEIKFSPTTGSGWNALRARSIQHPSELLNHSEFSAKFTDLLGQAHTASLVDMLNGPGTVEYHDNVMIAEGCQAHSCNSTSALVAIDMTSKTIMVALTDGSGPVFVAPTEIEWPDAAKPYLLRWRAKWQH